MTLTHSGASELSQLMKGTTAGALIPEIVRRGFQDLLEAGLPPISWTPSGGHSSECTGNYEIGPAQLVKHYAQLLVEADDELAIRNFDRCGWDAGELLWLLKTWES